MSHISSSDRPSQQVSGHAAMERNGSIVPWSFQRRAPRPEDIAFDVLFCGVCHTDLHSVGHWGQDFPLVPGHEMVGRVTEVGATVERSKVGDIVAVGVIVDSCRECDPCQAEMEVYCQNVPTNTYDGVDRIDGSRTRGGYAETYVADQRFVYHVPAGLELAGVAPLLCAGITTYSPLRHWNVTPGKTVGIIGVGGLGHLGLKFARAMGAHVVAFTTSPNEADDALALGAHEVVLSTDEVQMRAQASRFDFLLDTVSTSYPMNAFVQALKIDGTLCSLGLPDRFDVMPVMLAMGRRSIASSGAGGTRETSEMLAFCAEHGITADVELIAQDEINEAFDRLAANDVKYRFVIDMARRSPPIRVKPRCAVAPHPASISDRPHFTLTRPRLATASNSSRVAPSRACTEIPCINETRNRLSTSASSEAVISPLSIACCSRVARSSRQLRRTSAVRRATSAFSGA